MGQTPRFDLDIDGEKSNIEYIHTRASADLMTRFPTVSRNRFDFNCMRHRAGPAQNINEPKDDGKHRMTWDGRDTDGFQVVYGVYLDRLEAGARTKTRKTV